MLTLLDIIKQLADLRVKYNSQLEKNLDHETAKEDFRKQVDIFINDQKKVNNIFHERDMKI